MGQFRPISRNGSRRRGLPLDLLVFSLGFFATSIPSFALLYGIIGRHLSEAKWSRTAGVSVILLLVLVEVVREAHRPTCALGPRRQTPQWWGRSALGVFLWGCDAGFPMTTIRATTLPTLGLTLVALGWAGPLVGTAYAIGFVGCLWILQELPRELTTYDFTQNLLRARAFVRQGALVVALLGGVIAWVS